MGAIVVVLSWVFVIENLLGVIPGGFGDAIKKYGLSGVGSSLARTAGHATRVGQVAAGVLLLGYALALVIAGTMVVRQTRRQLVTATRDAVRSLGSPRG